MNFKHDKRPDNIFEQSLVAQININIWNKYHPAEFPLNKLETLVVLLWHQQYFR